MRKVIWAMGGMCAAAAGWLVWSRRVEPVQELAHQLETAWSDHHTRS